MAKRPTTIRLDDRVRKSAQREAEKMGLTLSGAIHLLLEAFSKGEMEIGVTQYPKRYLEKIHKELDDMERLRKLGKLKSYASGQEMMDDILKG